MTATNHALTGAIIGLMVSNPWVALPAALLSHLVCDAIPHFGILKKSWIISKAFQTYLIIDALLCIVLVAILFASHNRQWLQASACAFLATSPDLLWIRRFVDEKRGKQYSPNALEEFLKKIQWFEKPVGAAVEAAWAVTSVALLWVIL